MLSRKAPVARKTSRHRWLIEPLEDEATFVARPMFGSLAIYFHGLLTLVLCDKDEPWRGVLVATERDAHAALVAEIPALRPHPVLPKWLYLPEAETSFEGDAQRLVDRVRRRDPRIGVVPQRDRPAAAKRRPR